MMKPLLFCAFVISILCSVSGQHDAKTKRLAKLSQDNHGLVKLDSNSYFKYTQGKRDYGLVVLITALGDQFRCVPCRYVKKRHGLVMSSPFVFPVYLAISIPSIDWWRRASKRPNIQIVSSLVTWILRMAKLCINR